VRPKFQNGALTNEESSNSKSKFTTIHDVLRGLVDWLCSQVCFILQFEVPISYFHKQVIQSVFSFHFVDCVKLYFLDEHEQALIKLSKNSQMSWP
jgi:hypothetical protein